MSNLENEYTKLEKEFAERFGYQGQLSRIWETLPVLIRERSLAENRDPQEYKERLSSAEEFLNNLKLVLDSSFAKDNKKAVSSVTEGPASTNPFILALGIDKDDQTIWSHRRIDEVEFFGVGKDAEKAIGDQTRLLDACAEYLAQPWMQHNEIDWILLNSLMYSEILAYREGIYSGEVLGKTNWAYLLSEGNLQKSLWIRLLLYLSIWVLRHIIPPAAIGILFFIGYPNAAIVLAALYVLYLGVRMVLWPRRYRKRKKRGSDLKQAVDNFVKMGIAYSCCSPPIINPSTLREQMSKPTDIGPLFSGAIFALLSRIAARDQEVFLPFSHIPRS